MLHAKTDEFFSEFINEGIMCIVFDSIDVCCLCPSAAVCDCYT